jgi:exodeoxyribonuclease VII large subunit
MLVASRVEAAHTDIAHLAARVRALSPAATLERGYALVLAPNGSLVRTSSDVSTGDALDIRVAQGRLKAQVTDVSAG